MFNEGFNVVLSRTFLNFSTTNKAQEYSQVSDAYICREYVLFFILLLQNTQICLKIKI